ncbi:PadR family transcriptional regulator [Streptomyces sp. BV286]|uniref:PadR family transcriptional regulator n=1 Tax=Streptomyces sp. BV286 TaxID=2849672 RepID=UPI001C2E6B8D|nr:helix-turn-helix transcriptional regulator [Streptomyces sp. BV286]MBV1939892.1 PadR family transcriptional regulator [Streptomyces sp. BV286]
MEPFNRWTRVAIDVTRYVCDRHTADPNFEFYGFQAADDLKYGPGSIYPVLRRLERAGWLLRRDEQETEQRDVGRPARTYYRVNPDNLGAIRQRVAELDARNRSAKRTPSFALRPLPATSTTTYPGGDDES